MLDLHWRSVNQCPNAVPPSQQAANQIAAEKARRTGYQYTLA
jgi:hypothetical protein